MKLILLIFALLALVDASARVLVGKYFISKYPAAQQENVFEYELVNIGDTAAINVELSDQASFPTDRFEISNGSPTAKFARILPNSTAFHHIVVVPRIAQEIIDNNVIVDYTDAITGKVSRVSTNWFSKGGSTNFFPKDALRRLNGTTSYYIFSFAALTVPVTLCSAVFYFRSKYRYSTKKHN